MEQDSTQQHLTDTDPTIGQELDLPPPRYMNVGLGGAAMIETGIGLPIARPYGEPEDVPISI